MIVLHTFTPETYPKTTCGLKLERGVHRVRPRFLAVHLKRDDTEPCPECLEAS